MPTTRSYRTRIPTTGDNHTGACKLGLHFQIAVSPTNSYRHACLSKFGAKHNHWSSDRSTYGTLVKRHAGYFDQPSHGTEIRPMRYGPWNLEIIPGGTEPLFLATTLPLPPGPAPMPRTPPTVDADQGTIGRIATIPRTDRSSEHQYQNADAGQGCKDLPTIPVDAVQGTDRYTSNLPIRAKTFRHPGP